MSFPNYVFTPDSSGSLSGPRTRGVRLGQTPTTQAQAPTPSLFSNPLYLAMMGAAVLLAYHLLGKKGVSFAKNPGRTKQKKAKKRKASSSKKYRWRVQALRFRKALFSRKAARAWAKKNKRKAPRSVQVMKNFWSLRQESPKHFSQMRTIHMANGVMAIIGKPRPKKHPKKHLKKRLKKHGKHKLKKRRNPCMTGIDGSEVCF